MPIFPHRVEFSEFLLLLGYSNIQAAEKIMCRKKLEKTSPTELVHSKIESETMRAGSA